MGKNELGMYEKNYIMNSIGYVKKFIRMNFSIPLFSQRTSWIAIL